MIFKEENDRFLYLENDIEMGKIIFEDKDNIITINHTLVPKENSGRGIARDLVNRVVKKARDENKKIIPVCTYAKKVLESDEQYIDILSK
ncbi:GNAT family N-acetyltransferase [Peptoniphilus stercorisuis]|uniref:GNAT family acetyltransferase n=1 Tax=Peptoniphilus stercorisuis TaxID=1436965 RepID=A0ABS4KE83_9FIRM|nr:GNAT family N-acetyltransferase [Peptoniphilus stercorisuis]MBP2026077.1 putative GNAT family acetyltransferase [Peptoniphilus stercorisuis]